MTTRRRELAGASRARSGDGFSVCKLLIAHDSDSRRPSKAAPKYDKNGRLIKPVAVAEPKF